MRDLRVFLLMLLGLPALGVQALPQDDEATADEEAVVETDAADADEAPDSDDDELVIDSESYADIEEDDFRPTEEIDADQSIPFPTDI
ncbi:MAG: hypothetical protein AAFX10_04000 [Pseudomonadota bacterium]